MKHLAILSGLLLVASTTVANGLTNHPHGGPKNHSGKHVIMKADDIHVIELEESLTFNFDVNNYLPENFNPLKGKNDINWNSISIIGVPEDVNFNFDTNSYLPKDFNPLKGKNDINWKDVPLIEIEEEVQFNFNVMDYLPKGFNPNK